MGMAAEDASHLGNTADQDALLAATLAAQAAKPPAPASVSCHPLVALCHRSFSYLSALRFSQSCMHQDAARALSAGIFMSAALTMVVWGVMMRITWAPFGGKMTWQESQQAQQSQQQQVSQQLHRLKNIKVGACGPLTVKSSCSLQAPASSPLPFAPAAAAPPTQVPQQAIPPATPIAAPPTALGPTASLPSEPTVSSPTPQAPAPSPFQKLFPAVISLSTPTPAPAVAAEVTPFLPASMTRASAEAPMREPSHNAD